MCEFCENKKPLISSFQQKFCSIESYVSEIQNNVLICSALVQEADRLPFNVVMSIEINFCPICGRELRSEENE